MYRDPNKIKTIKTILKIHLEVTVDKGEQATSPTTADLWTKHKGPRAGTSRAWGHIWQAAGRR